MRCSKKLLRRILPGLAVASVLGCSSAGLPTLGGIFDGEGNNAIHVAENKRSNPDAPLLKYAASIRIIHYTDARNMGNPRKIGAGAENVSGMSGKDIVLDQDVAAIVTGAMKTRLDDAGFSVSEAQNANALFELSGVVKELTYDVKARDEISIAIETTLKEINTGKVEWSGVVVEKNDRFAGVSGNNKNDVAVYLRKELGIVTEKTVEALSASLLAARPELFNMTPMTPGTRATPGVTVLVAPAPAAPTANIASPAKVYMPQANAMNGLLLVNTLPARAKVYLDGVYYGLSPLRLEIEPGIRTVSVKMEGYKTASEKVSVRKEDTTEINFSLEH